jgi:hypothetical protein
VLFFRDFHVIIRGVVGQEGELPLHRPKIRRDLLIGRQIYNGNANAMEFYSMVKNVVKMLSNRQHVEIVVLPPFFNLHYQNKTSDVLATIKKFRDTETAQNINWLANQVVLGSTFNNAFGRSL